MTIWSLRQGPLQEFQESFNCALRQKILLQGHLYIFNHHICFYCNIFGFVQKRVIPFKVGRSKNMQQRLPCMSPHTNLIMGSVTGRGVHTQAETYRAAQLYRVGPCWPD